MSIRIVTINSSPIDAAPPYRSGADPLDQRYVSPFGGGPVPEEAAPFYTSISTRLRITGGGNDGYDGTATWTRIPIEISTAIDPSIYGDGFDQYILPTPSGPTDCFFVCIADMVSDYTSASYRDPQKQRPHIIASGQSITSSISSGGTATLALGVPEWTLETGPLYRNPYRYFGGVDMSGRTATQWRDLRGTYTLTTTSGGVTTRTDYTVG